MLSACLLDAEAFDRVQSFLHVPHFYADANARIYETVAELRSEGMAIDIVSVASRLRDKNKLQSIGGSPYLAQLSDATPAVAHVEEHAKRIVEKWRVRQIISTAQRVAAEGYGADIGRVSEWMQEVDARFYEVTRPESKETHVKILGVAAAEETERIRQRKANKGVTITGITTGIPTLDARIGGMQRGNKYTVAARPGMGKTGCALTMALAAARAGHGVIFISLEMPHDQLALRALSQEANIDGAKLGRGRITDEQFRDLTGACIELGKLPLVIFDESKQSVSTIRANVREGRRILKERFGEHVEVDEVIIDFLQIEDPGERGSGHEEYDLGQMALGNAQLAKDENCVVIELSQLNRDLEKRPRDERRPVLKDLRGSGKIEEYTFSVIFIYRDDEYKKENEDRDNQAELIVAKLRQGGARGTVRCKFKATTAMFYEASQNPDYEQLGDMFDDFEPGQYGDAGSSTLPSHDWHDDYDK